MRAENIHATHDFQGKAVLITGASSGIGAALALEFARAGADVALLARRESRLGEMARQIRGLGRKAIALRCDVCRDWEVKKAVEEARRQLGHIDVVVANAGIAIMGRLDDLDLNHYRRQFEVNVFGVLRIIYASLGSLEDSQGTLVLMGSVAGHIACPTASAYSMSKFALHGLALALVPELSRRGIAVTHVSPGYVQSEINTGTLPNHLRVRDGDPRKMPAEEAARRIMAGIQARRSQVTLSWKGRLKVWFPRFMSWLKFRREGRRAESSREQRSKENRSGSLSSRASLPGIPELGWPLDSFPLVF